MKRATDQYVSECRASVTCPNVGLSDLIMQTCTTSISG